MDVLLTINCPEEKLTAEAKINKDLINKLKKLKPGDSIPFQPHQTPLEMQLTSDKINTYLSLTQMEYRTEVDFINKTLVKLDLTKHFHPEVIKHSTQEIADVPLSLAKRKIQNYLRSKFMTDKDLSIDLLYARKQEYRIKLDNLRIIDIPGFRELFELVDLKPDLYEPKWLEGTPNTAILPPSLSRKIIALAIFDDTWEVGPCRPGQIRMIKTKNNLIS